MNENLIFIDTIYNPRPGDFSKLNKYCPIGRYSLGQWYNCRELFHNHLANCKIFFFSYEEGKYNSIIKFMKKAEEILKIEVKSEFGPTQRKDVIWIKPSKWWTCSSMRRSFLTILLRSSLNYSFFKDNFLRNRILIKIRMLCHQHKRRIFFFHDAFLLLQIHRWISDILNLTIPPIL